MVLRSSLETKSFPCFYNRVYSESMLFVSDFLLLKRVVLLLPFGSLRFLLHKILLCCLFLSESNIFKKFCKVIPIELIFYW